MRPHRPFLLDIGAADECCSNVAIEALHKAMAEGDGARDPFEPHHSPFVRDLIERFTAAGLARIDAARDELSAWLSGAHSEPGAVLERPAVAEAWRLTPQELGVLRVYLAHLPLAQWTLDDYALLVELLMQQYLPAGVLATEVEALAVQAHLLGRAQAHVGTIDAAAAGALTLKMPATVAEARRSFALPQAAAQVLEYGRLHATEAVRSMTDALRHRVKFVVLDHQSQVMAGVAPPQPLTQRLFDAFGTANLDWRRIALTEVGEMQNQGLLSAMEPGARVRRLEAYKGACAFCKRLDGRIFNVVRADDPDKDGWRDVWPGKTNVGRSASAWKRQGGELVQRPESERWWPAAGTQHPHCRGQWHVEHGLPAGGSPSFQQWLEQHLSQGRDTAGEA